MITEADKRRFFEDGYLLVENVVPEPLCRAVRSTVCEFLDMREDDPTTWPPGQAMGHGIVPLHHPQSLWNVRQHPAVHEVFAALHGTDALWVVFDRVSFKTRDEAGQAGLAAAPIHWDGNPATLEGLSIQGLVYLTDTGPDQGAFCCVPEIYRSIDRYLADHPDHGERRHPAVDPAAVEVIGGPAGSLLVWHRRMPHSSTFNVTDRPRWVQYVAMDPAGSEAERGQRIDAFSKSMPPDWAIVQKVPGQQIPEPGGPAVLTPLGARLVGLEFW